MRPATSHIALRVPEIISLIVQCIVKSMRHGGASATRRRRITHQLALVSRIFFNATIIHLWEETTVQRLLDLIPSIREYCEFKGSSTPSDIATNLNSIVETELDFSRLAFYGPMVKVLRHSWNVHLEKGIDNLLGTDCGNQLTQHLSGHVILPNLKEMRFLYNRKSTSADRNFQLLWKPPFLKEFMLYHDNGDGSTAFDWAIDFVNSSPCMKSLSWETWDPEVSTAQIGYPRLRVLPALTSLSLSTNLVNHRTLGWASKLPVLERLIIDVTDSRPWDLSDPKLLQNPCVFESLLSLDFCWSSHCRAQQLLEACRLPRLEQFKLRFKDFPDNSNEDQRRLYTFASRVTERCPTVTELSIVFGSISHDKKDLMARLLTIFQPLHISWLSLSTTPMGCALAFKGFLQDIIPNWPKLECLELRSYLRNMTLQDVVDTIVHFPMLRLLGVDSMSGPWVEPRIDSSTISDLPLDLCCYFVGHDQTDPDAIKSWLSRARPNISYEIRKKYRDSDPYDPAKPLSMADFLDDF